MTKASDHQSSSITKLLYIGDSGTRKTTSLISLLKAGYKLRIFDYDNLLDPLISLCRRDCPELLDNLEFQTFRDKMKGTPMGPVVDGPPRAFVDGLKALNRWDDDTIPAEWGPEYVAVIDTLTTMARSAYWWAKGLQGTASFAEGVSMKGYNPQQSFFTAQQAFMNFLSYLTANSFNTNVIAIAHVKYMDFHGVTKGFPVAVGSAISPEIPGMFPSIALAEKGLGETPRYMIRTRSTNLIDLKNPRSFDMAAELPMETGLADFFKGSKP